MTTLYNTKSMKVVLLKDNKNLGKKGDIITVADGFAFNNLIPARIAQPATKETIAAVERAKKQQEEEARKKKEELRTQAAQLDKKKISITQKAKDGKLFGSVTKKDIATAITKQHGITVEEENIQLDTPIKELTTCAIDIDYGDGITASIILTVAAE